MPDGRRRGEGTAAATEAVREASEWGVQRGEGEGLLGAVEREEGNEAEGNHEWNGEEESERQIGERGKENTERSDARDAGICSSYCQVADTNAGGNADADSDATIGDSDTGGSEFSQVSGGSDAAAAAAAAAGDRGRARGKISVSGTWLQGVGRGSGEGSGKGGGSGSGEQCAQSQAHRVDYESFQSLAMSWCVDHGFEFVECCAANEEFDKGKSSEGSCASASVRVWQEWLAFNGECCCFESKTPNITR